MPNIFKLASSFSPTGDQPQAIEKLVKGIKKGEKFQTLLGVTGSGKTFTMANVIEKIGKPTLIMSHNKTLAAQLCSEFQQFFPNNAVCYFVSYYDYYQPEAYLPSTDTYIAKDASINDEINKYRHHATLSLLTRKDVIIVASVSAIYGLGNKEDYKSLSFKIKKGESQKRDKILNRLADLQYTRSHLEFKQGMFNVLGDILEIFPPGGDNLIRIEFFGDEIEGIKETDSFTGEILKEMSSVKIFPAKHNVTTEEKISRAVQEIEHDLKLRYNELKKIGKEMFAERLKTRTEYDIEMLKEMGYVAGIENYVQYFSARSPGMPPSTLLDFFPDDFVLFIDESHMTIPQIGGMYNGNYSRKQTLIDFGFRLPSAHNNRPLKFKEFERHINQAVFVSATPGQYEAEKSKNRIIEQIIRPTGLVDPEIQIRSSKNQIKDLIAEMNPRISRGERVLITTLTKRSSEELTDFLKEKNYKVKYLHSDIDTLERIDILRELREGAIDIIIGINLLREGLDLPEVSLVAIFDSDKEGFLRSRDALIQTIGRTARNINGLVIMYADKKTTSMKEAIDETLRRRKIQIAYNKNHNITPKSIEKNIKDIVREKPKETPKYDASKIPREEIKRLIDELNAKMEVASQNLEFEKAADIRDQIIELERELNLK